MRLLLALLLTLSTLTPTSALADAETKQSEPLRRRGTVTLAHRDVAQRGAAFEARLVVRLVQSRRSALNACYDRQLASAPPFEGRVIVELTINASGSLSRVEVVEDTAGNGVAACVRRVIQGFRFSPAPAGEATFTLPFNLALVT